MTMDPWAGVASYGRLTPAAMLTDIRRVPPPPASSVWVPMEPVSIASGSGAVAETNIGLPATINAPQGTAAVVYLLSVSVGGGGRARVEVRHKPGGLAVLKAEASNAAAAANSAQGFVDWNAGRCTYVVTFTSSPTSVAWDVSVVGFLRAG